MSTIVTRSGKGSALTHNEMDANFTNLNTDKVEGQSVSVDSEIALFSGTGGKTIKRATSSGILKANSGVIGVAVSGTDYVAPGVITGSSLTMNTSRLLGRTTASSGDIEEITVGSGLSLSGGSLTATGGSVWVLLSSATASASATVDLETTFDSTYDHYVIVMVSVVPSSDGVNMHAQLKISGAYDTGANYYYLLEYSNSGGTTYAAVNGRGASYIVVGGGWTTAGHSQNATIYIDAPSGTSLKKMLYGHGVNINSTPDVQKLNFVGHNTGTGALTGVRFFYSSGNIASGSFYLYGVKKS